jgi:hypothetical protein
MNNKKLNVAIIDQVWQTSAEACLVWCIHECDGGGGCSDDSCTYGNGMPYCWKHACECNLLIIQIKCSILRKLIVHDHTYLQCRLLLSKCHVSLVFSLPIVLLHLQVVLFILPLPLLHSLIHNNLLRVTAAGTTTQTPRRRSPPRLHFSRVD